ncbi:TPA: RNA methyltransferase [Candidatus Falkowbacteria bacterium]|nr:RNA methyltransferase [Candidatus Falkowbacteria bacterium]
MSIKDPKITVILPNIRSLYNVGSIFRTADAVGIEKIYLTGYSGRPDKNEQKIAKTALGAHHTVPWKYEFHTWRVIEKLKQNGYIIIALEMTGESLDIRRFKPKSKLALMVGNEVKGLSPQLLNRCDHVLHLPMTGTKESLNVSIAFSIAAYYLKFFT